jgi:hypothetical protein
MASQTSERPLRSNIASARKLLVLCYFGSTSAITKKTAEERKGPGDDTGHQVNPRLFLCTLLFSLQNQAFLTCLRTYFPNRLQTTKQTHGLSGLIGQQEDRQASANVRAFPDGHQQIVKMNLLYSQADKWHPTHLTPGHTYDLTGNSSTDLQR